MHILNKEKFLSGLTMRRASLLGALMFAALTGVEGRAQQILSYLGQLTVAPDNTVLKIQLPQFDPSLGTLTDVTLIYSGNLTQNLAGENTGASAAGYDFSSLAHLVLAKQSPSPFGPVLIAPWPVQVQQSGQLGGFDGAVDFGGQSGVTVTKSTDYNGQFDDPNLPAYIGYGLVDFMAATESVNHLIMNGDSGVKNFSVQADTSVTLQYTYIANTAIPEPPSCAVGLGAVTLLGVIWRRRRTARASSALPTIHPSPVARSASFGSAP